LSLDTISSGNSVGVFSGRQMSFSVGFSWNVNLVATVSGCLWGSDAVLRCAGVAVFPRNAKNLGELLRAADGALRQAKGEGKNRAVLERRGSERLSPSRGVKIEVVDSSGKEKIKTLKIADISTNGMLLLSSQDIAGEELLCRVCCPENEVPFDLACKVKYKSKPEYGPYHIGVYFSKTPECIRGKLSNCIEFPKEAERDSDVVLK